MRENQSQGYRRSRRKQKNGTLAKFTSVSYAIINGGINCGNVTISAVYTNSHKAAFEEVNSLLHQAAGKIRRPQKVHQLINTTIATIKNILKADKLPLLWEKKWNGKVRNEFIEFTFLRISLIASEALLMDHTKTAVALRIIGQKKIN